MMKLAVIGAGRWGPNLARNFNEFPDVDLCGIVDLDPAARQACEQTFPNVSTFETLDQLLENVTLDAVVIATPVQSHYELAKKCLELNLHIMVEKPLCQKPEDILELEKLSKERNLVLMVDHVFLFNPGIQKIKDILNTGDLGEIIYLKATRTNLGPVRLDVNALWDLASHDLSIFNWWLEDTPHKVSATGITGLNPNVEDVIFGTFVYPGERVGQVHASWLNPHKVREIVVVGQKQMLVWNDLSETPVSLFNKGIRAGDQRTDSYASHRTVVHSGSIQAIDVPKKEPLKEACRHFVDCVMSDIPCVSGAKEAYDIARSFEAADQSLKESHNYIDVSN